MSTVATMTLDRFAQMVEAYGAEAQAWPEAERDAALALCAESDEAKRLRAEAGALDMMLAQSEPAAADRNLENRIMADYRLAQRGHSPRPRAWIGPAAIAASLVVGVTAAWIAMSPPPGVDLSDPAAWEVLGDDLEFGAKQ